MGIPDFGICLENNQQSTINNLQSTSTASTAKTMDSEIVFTNQGKRIFEKSIDL